MKIGLLFGSFNPIHTGHLIIAEHVINYHTEEVWFVVSPQNPFKKNAGLLDIEKRLLLVRSAIKSNKKFSLCDIELSLPKPTYTINTLQHLKQIYPQHEFYVIIGSDNFSEISKWKSPDILLSDFNFLIYQRPGFMVDAAKLSSNIKLLNAPLLNISSTQIRSYIKEKKSIRYLVPDATLKLISSNKFYLL